MSRIAPARATSRCVVAVDRCENLMVALGHLFGCGATEVRVARADAEEVRLLAPVLQEVGVEVAFSPDGAVSFTAHVPITHPPAAPTPDLRGAFWTA